MKRHLRRGCALAAAVLLAAALLCGCGADRPPADPDDVLTTTAPLADKVTEPGTDPADETEEEDLEIDTFVILNDDATAINGTGASFGNGRLTITGAGVYSIKGTLTDGQIYVDTNDDEIVKLYLEGVEIYCADSAPLYVAQSPKETQIILAKGSENKLSDNGARAMADAQADDGDFATAAVYSRDDLQIEGGGALTIEANFQKGIFSRDDLRLKSGTLRITAQDDGIRGKDSVTISGGTLKIKCGGDGIRTANDKKGDLSVSGGDVTVESAGDCLQAAGDLSVSGGSFRLQSGDGYQAALQSQQSGAFGFGKNRAQTGDDLSAKGLKAEGNIAISGGAFLLSCLDDAIHAGENAAVSGGMFRVSTNDDALHAEESAAIAGGEWIIEASYEGLEARQIAVSGGTLDITAADDGINAAAPDDQNDMTLYPESPDGGFGFRRQGGPGREQPDESCVIAVSGGAVQVNAAGDGLDSNGSITVSGGTVLVFGPTDDGNAAIDYTGSCTVTGGTLCALGSAGMAQGVSGGSAAALEAAVTLSAGDTLSVRDDAGEEIYAVRVEKQAAHLVLAGGPLQKGRTYALFAGGSERGTAEAK